MMLSKIDWVLRSKAIWMRIGGSDSRVFVSEDSGRARELVEWAAEFNNFEIPPQAARQLKDLLYYCSAETSVRFMLPMMWAVLNNRIATDSVSLAITSCVKRLSDPVTRRMLPENFLEQMKAYFEILEVERGFLLAEEADALHSICSAELEDHEQ
ncbi:hypothetical protein SH467x_002706 [Pirellulaceae bacterium SH467]